MTGEVADLHGPPVQRPPDLDASWTRTLEDLAATPVALKSSRQPPMDRPGLALDLLSFTSSGGARIHGYRLSWRDSIPRPVVVHAHGYGGEVTVRWHWAAAGVDVVGVDLRGFGRSAAAVEPSPWGWILTGIETPETHVVRGAVCDYLRAVDVARRLAPGPVPVVCTGTSLAGAIALLAQAWGAGADLVAAAVPTFTWTAGRHLLVGAGSGQEVARFLAAAEEAIGDVETVLTYTDPLLVADRVTGPVLLGVGEVDPVVPAATVVPLARRLPGPVEVMAFPASHVDDPRGALWEAFEARLLARAVALGRGPAASVGGTEVDDHGVA